MRGLGRAAVAAAMMLLAVGAAGQGAQGASEARPAQAEVEWGYSGAEGPAHWGSLSPEYVTCSHGRAQSPIDIRAAAAAPRPIEFHDRRTHVRLVNNGHTIEGVPSRPGWIVVSGKRYDLIQLHFHSPSEHRVRGRRFAMELHMVHRSEDGELIVVTALIGRGGRNGAYAPLLADLPRHKGESVSVPGRLSPKSLLPGAPARRARWVYDGSLTTPPCTQGVTFIVHRAPVRLSASQIRRFRAVYDHNSRPVQPLNGRTVTIAR